MKVNLYTDGAARGNPDGPGGYGAILTYVDTKGILHEKELTAGYVKTTNNRMELTAAIEGLSALKRKCEVSLYTDSQYVANGITKGWAKSWRAKGWIKSDKKPALNSDLWATLLDLLDEHEVTVIWVKGHAGHPENELCDRLAVEAYKNL